MSHAHHHGGGSSAAVLDSSLTRLGLVGSPNSGKSTLFNALTGLRVKTGNYPGVTVSRAEGVMVAEDGTRVVLEDLPGTYSLDPISPDEQVVADLLALDPADADHPEALLLVADATTLRRGLTMVAHALAVELPATLVLTFGDELALRGGSVDVTRLSRALGIPVLAATAGDARQREAVRAHLATDPAGWAVPPVAPPTDPAGIAAWIDSVLEAARYAVPRPDGRTRRIDDVLLHPVWGTLVFLVTMFAFFQVIFTVAAPLQALVEELFGWLGERAAALIPIEWLGRFVAEALIGGVGGVVVFLPQILLLFLMISLLESTGYMTRAAFLMDRVMSRFGLEGRSFVALLSSLACAVPGIMATRSLPSARDRLATMMAAPSMTCSARLPVYVLLISLLVPSEVRWGPVGLQGLVMFALYLGGATASMLTAAFWSRVVGRRQAAMPFYMEMPPYRLPKARTVVTSMWASAEGFLRKVTSIILVTTALLWVLLNVPVRSEEEMAGAGVAMDDPAAVAQYTIDHSAAAAVGKAVEPAFEPLGFDWRIDVGVLASLAAREVFVATLGQMAAAEDPEDPGDALASWTVTDDAGVERPLFTPDVVAALLVFFMLALQCMSTLAVMRRETGTWRWPLLAFGYYFTLAWLAAFAVRHVVLALT
ncbi:ferrous iron transporter B [Micrococcus sp. ACRRV]|uniref:ferrous iron transporter B n=1 Tax=Micrococcus sp. ACRRV TaxID=2918203 RepID=UPI001EF38144|nr:ferrous iron transporter B [Micrococcus sp. ACRRV]MCG7421943.1 ferrous iron transporter B [Micrococcus sp. ACRRV]